MLGYFGPQGTFTHQALISIAPDAEAQAFPSVMLALDAVRSGETEASLVPIENSVEGGVTATLDNLAMGAPLTIVREVLLPVQFSLAVRAGTKTKDVRRVLTHPHAAAQCRTWVTRHLPHASVTEGGSTAAAAAEVADPDSQYDAAICARIAAELYGLTVAVDRIADNAKAVTRFVLVGPAGAPPARTGHDKTTVVAYMYKDRPGALLEILEQFAGRGVNLCRIESRPTKAALGDYCFSIDVDGHVADPRIREALKGLHRVCKKVVYLGSYERADGVVPSATRGFTDEDFYDADLWLENIDPTASTRSEEA
ncbi:prephenate dehydratase [Propionicicella superfundia]|uniref:prephenate dehydratase n=1 Tax=Propionicicella superfundia TaxID=348582 RepID=UPI0003F52CC5|nr:prephenate dehydratase [Propionicicella superfundia]